MIRVNNKHFSFNNIRALCLNPSSKMSEGRKELAEKAALLKGAAGLSEITAGSIAIVSLFAMSSSLWFAPLAVASALTALAMHEVRVISRNGEKLAEGGILNRAQAALSPSYFTKALLKGTLVTEDLFGSTLTKSLEQSRA